MGLTREFLESRRSIIPLRIKVYIHSLVARDGAPVRHGPFLAERRPGKSGETRGEDAAGRIINYEYAFFQADLGNLQPREGDVIEDITLGQFHAIDTGSNEMSGLRLKFNCYQTVNPSIQVL